MQLATFSKSVSATQGDRATWEREMEHVVAKVEALIVLAWRNFQYCEKQVVGRDL